MSKKIKTWLIIAVSLMLVGGIIFVGVMSMLKWNFTELNTTKYETNVYEINDFFTNISINTDTADVLFLKSSDGKCKIECFERQKEKHTVTVQDKTLKIDINDTRKWYEYITFFGFGTPKIKVYLPQDKYGLLMVNISTGDVEIPNDFTFDSVDIKGSTGHVECKASATNDLKIKLSTGDIDIENITAGNIDLTVSTGDIELSGVECVSLTTSGNTGDFDLEKVVATQNFNFTWGTGDIEFDHCDAGEIFVKASTGDIEGSLLSDKVFICNTSTGRVNVPKTITGGKCEITTSTGDIKLKIIN